MEKGDEVSSLNIIPPLHRVLLKTKSSIFSLIRIERKTREMCTELTVALLIHHSIYEQSSADIVCKFKRLVNFLAFFFPSCRPGIGTRFTRRLFSLDTISSLTHSFT